MVDLIYPALALGVVGPVIQIGSRRFWELTSRLSNLNVLCSGTCLLYGIVVVAVGPWAFVDNAIVGVLLIGAGVVGLA